jgi:ferric-dicitrate binding protein FerR (iron transport regulator)
MTKDFSILVSKTLAGEASEEEKLRLRELLQNSEQDTLLYNQIKEYWNAGVTLDSNLSESVENRIRSTLGVKPASIRHNFAWWFYRVAAVTLLLFSVGSFIYYRANPAHSYTFATQEDPVSYTLQDGSSVKLNKNSSLTYTSDFGKKYRRVDLQGEAYFEVTKNAAKPFRVLTQGTETEVLGTKFNLLSDNDNKEVTVTLVEGAVRFEADKCSEILTPREEIVYSLHSENYSKQTTDLQYHTAWTKGRYIYPGILFGELVKKLEHIYGVTILLNSPQIEDRKVSASFVVEQPVEEILSILGNELKFDYTMKDDVIKITKRQVSSKKEPDQIFGNRRPTLSNTVKFHKVAVNPSVIP